MCPVLSHWENGQEGCEGVDEGPSTSSTIERDWRQSLPKKLEKAEMPPDSGQGNSFCNPLTKKRGYSKLVNEYYEKQNEILSQFSDLDTFEERMALNADAMQREREKTDKAERLAIQLSNIANVLLFALKVYASIASRSLAIIASTLDSLLDMLSGFILWYTARSMRRVNPYKYPIGKKRMQPLGIIVFASIMAMLGLQVLVEAARDFFSSDHSFHLNSLPWVVGVMVGVTGVKLCLFLLCRLYDNDIVQAYAKDHFFDVVTNSLGLAAALLADRFEWWIDPTGAIVLALYTIVNWSGTVRENVQSLVGQSAPPEFLAKITYLCWNHHRDILQIDTVRAYVFGSHMFAEVDIVLPGSMPLREAHDIGEALQNKLELLPEIERAFVHLDFEVSHKPEHNKVLVPATPGRAQASADAESAAVAEAV